MDALQSIEETQENIELVLSELGEDSHEELSNGKGDEEDELQ